MNRRLSVPSVDVSQRLPVRLLAVAMALALTGTTVAVRRSIADDGPPSDPRAAAVAALAAHPWDAAGSARYVVRYFLVNSGIEALAATFEGEADFRRQRFRARARFFQPDGPPLDSESFVFARWEYTRNAGDRHWQRGGYDPSELGSPTPELAIVGMRDEGLAAPAYAGDADIRRWVADALVADVVPAGREEQYGATVWRYRVTVDANRAAARLPEALRREMKAFHEGEARQEVDLWLDGRERLRKLAIFYPDEERLGFRIENEFWDFGGPGRLDLPEDLDDPTAVGGEGTTSFTVEPGVDLDEHSPGFSMNVSDSDRPIPEVSVRVEDRPPPGGESRRRTVRMTPPAGRHLEPGEYRLVDRAEPSRGVARTFDVTSPEVDARCPRDRPRSGTLTVEEAVMYEERFYVRLHLRFTVSCPSTTGPVEGELRYYALT